MQGARQVGDEAGPVLRYAGAPAGGERRRAAPECHHRSGSREISVLIWTITALTSPGPLLLPPTRAQSVRPVRVEALPDSRGLHSEVAGHFKTGYRRDPEQE